MSNWLSDGNWLYEVSENNMECTVKSYNGKNENIVVPEKCGGYSVTAFGNGISSVFPITKVKTVVLAPTITEIKNCAFLSCKSLQNVKFSANLKYIGDNAFLGCTALQSIELPVDIITLNFGVFCGCQALSSVFIPSNIKHIKSCAFLKCYNLKNLILSEGLKSIGHYAFGMTKINKVVLPGSIECIENDSFDDKVSIN